MLAAVLAIGSASCARGRSFDPAWSQTLPDQSTQTESATEIAAFDEDIAVPDSTENESQWYSLTEPQETATIVPTTLPAQVSEPAQTTEPTQPQTAATTTEPVETTHFHAYRTAVAQPTCTERGYKLSVCSDCGDRQIEYTADALGHDFGAYVVTKEAACGIDGVETRTCARCGLAETRTIPKQNHQMTEFTVTKAATPTAKGEKMRYCTLCGMKETEEIPKVRPYESKEAAQELLRLINAERAKAGVGALTFNNACYPCAQIRAHEIVTNYSHTRPNGKQFYTVIDENGQDRAGGCAENLYNPYGDDVPPADANTAFMNSEGHRINMLNPLYKSASICVLYTEERTYFVELFFG